MSITDIFRIRYHFQFRSLEDGLWRSVYGYNDEDLAREVFATEMKTGAWANAIRLLDTEQGCVLLEEAVDPTGGITLDALSHRLSAGETAEEIQKSLQQKQENPDGL